MRFILCQLQVFAHLVLQRPGVDRTASFALEIPEFISVLGGFVGDHVTPLLTPSQSQMLATHVPLALHQPQAEAFEFCRRELFK